MPLPLAMRRPRDAVLAVVDLATGLAVTKVAYELRFVGMRIRLATRQDARYGVLDSIVLVSHKDPS